MHRLQIGPQAVAAITTLILLGILGGLSAAAWRAAEVNHVEQLESARLQFIVDEVKGALDASLQLGVSLPNLSNAQPQLDAVFQRHTDIVSMDIADDAGQIVFSTDAAGIGARIADAWRLPCAAAASANSQAQISGQTSGNRWRCAGLVDGIGQVVGVVLVRQGVGADPAPGEARSAQLLAIWLLPAGLMGLLFAALAARFTRRMSVHLLVIARHSPGPKDAAVDARSISSAPAWSAAWRSGTVAIGQLSDRLTAAEAEVDQLDAVDVG